MLSGRGILSAQRIGCCRLLQKTLPLTLMLDVGGVEQADDVVNECRHRFACSVPVALGNGYRNFLMVTDDHFRLCVAQVVDEGVVDTPEGRAWVKRTQCRGGEAPRR